MKVLRRGHRGLAMVAVTVQARRLVRAVVGDIFGGMHADIMVGGRHGRFRRAGDSIERRRKAEDEHGGKDRQAPHHRIADCPDVHAGSFA